jgi:NADPH:quinone reductase
MVGEIISERRATSNRNGGRHHRGFAGDFPRNPHLEHPILPARIGHEAAGTVDALGEGVTGFAIGDKVSTMPGFSMNRYGVYGEQTIIPAAMTVTHPNSLSWEHAAAIWMPYMTAYGALG